MWITRLFRLLARLHKPASFTPQSPTAMPWNIRRDFHIDINASYGRFLLVSATDSSLRQPPPDMVAGDGMPVRFHFWERGADGALIAADPGSSTVFIFSGRPAGAPSGSDLLFLTNDFAELEAGVWEGTLDLTPAEFAAHLTDAANGAKIILGELEVRDGVSNTKRNSFQFDLTARRQVYNGEAPPIGMTSEEWLMGSTVPVSESVAITGTLSPDAAGTLIPVNSPVTALYPGKKQWSTDGNNTRPGTGSWVTAYTGLLKTPETATLEQIAPKANYLATGSQSSASQVQVLQLGVGWIIYWLYDVGGGVTRWVDAADAGMADQGAASIPAGRLIYPNTRKTQKTFIGGLGATWETSPTAEFLHYVIKYNGTSADGSWWSYGATPFSATYAPQGSATGVATATLTPTTAAPPYFRVVNGRLWVQEAGVWKKTALSVLDIELPGAAGTLALTADITPYTTLPGSQTGVPVIDFAQKGLLYAELTGNTTITFQNLAPGIIKDVLIWQSSGWGINWPAGIKWVPGSVIPTSVYPIYVRFFSTTSAASGVIAIVLSRNS